MLVFLPLLIPLATAVACLAVRGVTRKRVFGLGGSVLHLGAAIYLLSTVLTEGIQTAQAGAWPAPIGVSLVADIFSALMVVVAVVVGLAVHLYSLTNIDIERSAFGYEPLIQFLLAGVCGAFLTGDIFNLFVWFEVTLNSSFVLMALGGERRQVQGALKYVVLNLIASSVFLTAAGLLYGFTGTLNMADLSRTLAAAEQGPVNTIFILFAAAFGIKAALFPFFSWLPASYFRPPAAISALFAGLLTEVGVYSLVRVSTLLFPQHFGPAQTALLVLSGVTMVIGALCAISQGHFGRLLCFLVVAQSGFMLMGLSIFTRLALAASVFYILHDAIVKTNLFLIYGVAGQIAGTHSIRKMGGLSATHPVLALLFLITALSLAGIPPLSGFAGKLGLVQAGIEAGQYGITATAIAASLIILYVVLRLWSDVFWGPPREQMPDYRSGWTAAVPVAVLALFSVVLGIGAEPVVRICLAAADQLLDPGAYAEAVLGAGQ